MNDLLKRLRKQKREYRDGKWVDTVNPVNPDGPEAADVIEKLQYDFMEALRMSKEEAFLRGMSDGRQKVSEEITKMLKENNLLLQTLLGILTFKAENEGVSSELSLDDLELSARARNALWLSCNVKTVEQLISLTRIDLLRTQNIGRKTIKNIEEALAVNGLKLAEGGTTERPDVLRNRFGHFIQFKYD